jgi:hypothetical protein
MAACFVDRTQGTCYYAMRFLSDVDLLLHLFGRIAQLVRALPLQGRGHRFDPCSAYHVSLRFYFLGPSFSLV